ncbi:MAG: tetratricopeptide repeat protein [Endomicrobium sp.]|jgi:tetratricopeptide (TPR) repeat protein|uniref:tetratricopeptide repeat protein n=1 Tax=Candidatus Endomicrobiellum cubanum TaxID=3242325 RepID=UPI0028253E2E|nr:tetratricopeptide repeat protein [Endomicrobium sp.]
MKWKVSLLILCFALVSLNKFSFATKYDAYKAFLQGMYSLKTRSITETINKLEYVTELDKNAMVAHGNLAYLYLRGEKQDKALEIAQELEKLDGNNPKTTSSLAVFYMIANKLKLAKEFWEKTLKLDPENEVAIAYIASLYQFDNKLEKSLDYWTKFSQQQPDNPLSYLQLANIQEKLGLHQEALKSYDKTIKINPNIRNAFLSKAHIYESLGQVKLAIKEYKKYIANFPDDVNVLSQLGKCYYDMKNYSDAKDILFKAKKISFDDIKTNYWLAMVYEKTKQIDKAIPVFKIVVNKDQRNIAFLTRLGHYYALKQNYKQAEKYFLKALTIEPNNKNILYLASLNYIDWGKYNEAIEYLNKIIKESPDFADAYFYLGISYDKDKKFSQAEKALLQAIKLNPQHSQALNYLGYSYAQQGIKLDGSKEFIAKSLGLEPKNSNFMDSLGRLYFKLENFYLAEKTFIYALSIMQTPLTYTHLGDTYLALKNYTKAWISYSLSYDSKQDKLIKNKLHFVQSQMPKEELYKLMLLRSKSNYDRLLSFKTGFRAKISSRILSKKLYLYMSYSKGENIKFDFPSLFVIGGMSVTIAGKTVKIDPEAAKNEIPQFLLDIIDQFCIIFSEDFYAQFLDVKPIEKGSNLIYSKNNSSLTINSNTALIESLSQNNILIEFLKYKVFLASKVPVEIKIFIPSSNIKVILEATKIFEIRE